MAKLYNPKKLKKLNGGLLAGKADALVDKQLLQRVRLRRRQLGQMTMALDIESASRRVPEGSYHVSRKVDGEFTCLAWNNGEICTLNPGGTIRANAPFLEEASKLLKAAGIKKALLGGELYVQRSDGERARVHDVVRVARNPADKDEVAQLGLACFNIYDLDGKDLSMLYDDAIAQLQQIFKKGKKVHAVETIVVSERKAVLKQFKQWVLEEGEEGIVVRSDTAGIYKIKPRHSLDLAVIGFTESIDDRAGLLHDLLLAVVRPSGNFQLVSRVGGGFSEEERASILKKLQKRVVDSDFREVNSDRVAYQMVEPGLVIEIECLDLISRTSRGNPIDKMILEWNTKDKRWEGIRRLPLCSVISPQFIRFRDDKDATADDVKVSQLTDIVDIPEIDRKAEEINLPKSTIMERVVSTKTLKGKTMVRKIMTWKTNKEEDSRDYPAYVIQLTDFSPNRAAPLKYEMRVSSSEAQIKEFYSQWQEKYFVRGWKAVE